MSVTSDFWKAMNQAGATVSNSSPSGSNKKSGGAAVSGSSQSTSSGKKKKSISEEFWEAMADDDIAPVASRGSSVASRVYARANGGKKDDEEEQEKGWFQKGLFEDGYDFGDITKTILGTGADVLEDLGAGIAEMPEKIADAAAMIAPYFAQSQINQAAYSTMNTDLLKASKEYDLKEEKKKAGEFVAKDLYDGAEVAHSILNPVTDGVSTMIGQDYETASVLGEKADYLAQSGGQLLATAGLQMVGVPWFLTTGATTFGVEAENALNQGASHEQAMGSAAISAATEILTEKISGGIKFGGKAADDWITERIARGITNKLGRALTRVGVDAAGESFEELLSEAAGKVGSSLYREESLWELLSNEEALDDYLDAMIGGGLLGGVSGGTKAVNSARKGVDYVSGLTKNEQKVVDKVYKDRLAEEQKNGKITEKQKDKIYEKVLSDMDKGYITSDTIEEVLGGDGYNSYLNLKAEADEYKTLYETESGKLSERQKDRLAELKEKNKAKSYEDALKEAQGSLSENVFTLVKGDRLVESYNERSRRGQAFEADLTQYDAKQQEVIKRAVDSGILNNTNRTHEFVDMVAKISADKGVLFDFTNNQKLKESGFAVDGKQVNGYVTKDGITLNIDSAKAMEATVGHEITHVLEGTEVYDALKQTLFKYAKTKGEYQTRYDSLAEMYKDIQDADIDKELAADLVGDYLFNDTDFIKNLSTQNRNVFQKIYDEIKYLCKVVTAGSKEGRELERVKKAFEDAYREGAQKNTTDGGVQYSIHRDVVDVTGREYDSVVELDKTVSARTLSEPKRLFSYIQKNLVGLKIPVIDAQGNNEIIEFARADETVAKNGKRHPVLGELAYAKGDTRKKVIVNAKEVIEESTHDPANSSATSNHGWLDKNGWESRKTYVLTQDGMIYEAYLKIAKAQDGRNILYAVNLDINKGIAVDKGATQKRAAVLAAMPSGEIVTQEGSDVKHSLSDSAGRQLTAEQQEYFKDSKMRDENGNLKVMYHGTPNGNFTVFKDGTYFTDSKEYADRYQNPGASSISTGKEASNPKTYEVYLDIKKPFDLGDAGARNIYINDYIKGGNAMGINPYLSDADYDKIQTIDWTEGEDLRDFLIENGYDYDGLVLDEGGTGGYGDEVQSRGKSYVVFSPEQVKTVDNVKPTTDPDIRHSLSNVGEQHTPDSLSALRLETEDIAPTAEDSSAVAENATAGEAPIYESNDKNAPEGQAAMFEPVEEAPKRSTRKELHQNIIDSIIDRFDEKGFDFDTVLKKARNLSTWSTVDNTPQRVMEKALGYKEGGILADITVNKVAQNESEGIKWINEKVKVLKEISKQYHIKPGSKESAAAQMYAEGFYVNENNEIIRYGEPELIQDFKNPEVRRNIKALAGDPRIRKIYDDTLASINESRTRNLYPEIPRLDNYFLHFRAMNDTFSTLGLPFNPNDIRAKDLPTDLNGVTADLKPGQPYFASAMHRKGKRTSFDMLGGIERYLNSAKNQIYHIDDIQTLRALRNYIAETYGQATGLEDIDNMSDAEAEERIKQVYGSHLSTFAKFLNEEANVLAGKTALIDRGIEGIIGRRGITFLNTLNQQVGSNMVGYNVSSSLTNFLPVAQTFAKTNKFDFTKAFAQTVANKVSGGRLDSFAKDSPVVIRRKGSDRFYQTPWQKMQNPGYVLMSAVDDISTELIARTKYNEFTRKGMDSQKAHFETDKWVSKLMGDRSLGQQPQLYNSKMLGLVTKFQLEVRNQLDSQFYDTIQETKASNEHIQNGLARNAMTAAKVASTFTQLAVAQHLFGKAFESVAGYNPAFDIIEVLMTAFGYDDDEESEDTALDNLEQGFFALLEDLPYASTFTGGGRIPISSALPIGELVKGEDKYGNEKSRWETIGEVAPYYLMPAGYGQIKKTVAGMKMFSDEHPIAGSYTDAGNLRFPVEDTLKNRVQAAVFGQYASENARKYFDEEQRTLNPEQTEIFAGLDMPIEDYWEYRDNLYEFYDVKDQLKEAAYADGATDEDALKYRYISSVYNEIYDLYDQQKEIASGDGLFKQDKLREIQTQMSNMLSNSKSAVDNISISGAYAEVGDRRYNYDAEKDTWYEIKPKNSDGSDNWFYQKEQEVTEGLGISYEEYWNNREEYNYAYDKPGRYAIAQTVGGYDTYMEHYDVLENWKSDNYLGADKDSKGNSISGSRKNKVIEYINGLDADYGAKIILYRTVYSSKADKNTYNSEIIDYLNSRDDISYDQMKSILEELEMEVDSNGYITW